MDDINIYRTVLWAHVILRTGYILVNKIYMIIVFMELAMVK